jgi:hypothetical protein
MILAETLYPNYGNWNHPIILLAPTVCRHFQLLIDANILFLSVVHVVWQLARAA